MAGQIKGSQLSSTIILSGSFSGSFIGDGSGLTGTGGGSTPTLQQVTDEGASTTNLIEGNITSASLAVTASHALFAISASHEVIKEVSSSHANFADLAGGLSGIPSIVVNQITASGDISASSAIITALTGSFNHIITDDDTIEFRNKSTGVQTGRLKFDPTTGLNVEDNTGARTKIRAGRGEFLSLEAGPAGFNSLGPISASVNISASGDIIGGGLNINGTTTFNDGNITNVGGIFLDFIQDDGANGTSIILNPSSINFAVSEVLNVFTVGASGNVTASGNITASGTVVGSNLSGTNTGDQDLSNLVTNSSTASFAITGSNVIFGSITSSGNISSSNTVFGVTGSFNQISSNPASNKSNITIGINNIDIGNTSTAAGLGIPLSFPFTKLAGSTTLQGMVAATNFLVGSGSVGDAIGGIPVNSTLRIGGVGTGFFGTTYTVDVDITGNVTASGNISASGQFIGNGSGLTNLQRPITTHTVNFSASAVHAGNFNIVGGNFTCSISTSAAVVGAEWEFFQTSSTGNFLFETGSGITMFAKDGNLKLAGQSSAATLKKISADSFALIGDLTS